MSTGRCSEKKKGRKERKKDKVEGMKRTSPYRHRMILVKIVVEIEYYRMKNMRKK